MPIYQYKCSDCGHQKEALQKMSDPVLTDCPACGAAALRKQVTAAAFKLKGTGWYETDFKNAGKKPAAEAANSSKNESNNSSSSGDGSDNAAVSADQSGATKATQSKTESDAS